MGTRNQIVACDKGDCAMHFATRKDISRQEHIESGEELDMTPFQAIRITSAPMVCPAMGY